MHTENRLSGREKTGSDFSLSKREVVAKSEKVPSFELFSPAKLNLFLAITGRRPDGFHDLVSLVTPVKFGDRLTMETTGDGSFALACDDPAVPLDDSNLILKAARLFREASGEKLGARFVLEKRIPMGAGLGGGSSNAVAVLTGLNQRVDRPVTRERLLSLAAKLGSDCALFLHAAPLVMRGRGERVELVGSAARRRLSGRRVLIFKPSFGIATAWAYGQMVASAPGGYLPAAEAEKQLGEWLAGEAPAEQLLFNNMERAAFEKYVALPVLLRRLKIDFGLTVGMSGSGSACFTFLKEDTPVSTVRACIRQSWGEHTFMVDTEIV